MDFKNAKYYKGDSDKPDVHTCINVEINGVFSHVPIDSANSHYAEILRQVGNGTITVAEADSA